MFSGKAIWALRSIGFLWWMNNGIHFLLFQRCYLTNALWLSFNTIFQTRISRSARGFPARRGRLKLNLWLHHRSVRKNRQVPHLKGVGENWWVWRRFFMSFFFLGFISWLLSVTIRMTSIKMWKKIQGIKVRVTGNRNPQKAFCRAAIHC